MRKSDKSLFSPEQNKLKINLRHGFVETAEDDNVKINASGMYSVPFCSSKLVHFFKYPFREKRVLSFALLDKWNVNNSTESLHFRCFL